MFEANLGYMEQPGLQCKLVSKGKSQSTGSKQEAELCAQDVGGVRGLMWPTLYTHKGKNCVGIVCRVVWELGHPAPCPSERTLIWGRGRPLDEGLMAE